MQKYRPLKINLVLPQFTKYYSNDKNTWKYMRTLCLKFMMTKKLKNSFATHFGKVDFMRAVSWVTAVFVFSFYFGQFCLKIKMIPCFSIYREVKNFVLFHTPGYIRILFIKALRLKFKGFSHIISWELKKKSISLIIIYQRFAWATKLS